MKNYLKLIAGFIGGAAFTITFLGWVATANANPYIPFQGGTGTSTIPAKGSLLVGVSPSQYGVLPVGGDGTCPTASSSTPFGIAWATCGSTTTVYNPFSLNGPATLFGAAHSSFYFPTSTAGFTTSTYTLDDTTNYTYRWVHSSFGSMTFSGGALTLTTPTSTDSIATRTFWSNILNGYDTITFDVNFHGNSLHVAGDTPELVFVQSSTERGIILTRYATNGTDGWQTVTLPLSKFTSGKDSSPTSTGTGTALDPTLDVNSLKFRAFDNTAGNTVSIRNIVLSDSSHTLVQDFTQPDLLNEPKLGNSLFRIQSVDFMKVSKDNMFAQYTNSQMTALVGAMKPLNLTHIAIDVPYDAPADYPSTQPVDGYAQRWANAVRAGGYSVFWREHWNAWEGDYSFAKATSSIGLGTASSVISGADTTSYLAKTYAYIVNHASQYAPGDIITPMAEPENGGINGITTCTNGCQFTSGDQFRQFLMDGITVVNAALDRIGLKGKIYVGYYGTSGFIVWGNGGNPHGFLDDRVADAMGIITTDDYPNPTANITGDLTSYESVYGDHPLVVTEYGTINETSTAAQIAAVNTYVGALKSKPYIYGFNYWSATAGANEDLVSSSTLLPIHGYPALQAQFTSGKPISVATALKTSGPNPIDISASSVPTAGQVLMANSTTSASWQTISTSTWGFGSASTKNIGDFFSVTNNLSESTNTSSLRTNIGYYSASGTFTGLLQFTGGIENASGTHIGAPYSFIVSKVAGEGDYTDIQSAINADCALTSPGLIFVKKGTYALGSTGLTIPSGCDGISIVGENESSTRITYTGSGTALNAGDATSSLHYLELGRFTLSGSSAGLIGINAQRLQTYNLHDLYITGFTQTNTSTYALQGKGLVFDGVSALVADGVCSNLHFDHNDIGILVASTTNAIQCTGLDLYGQTNPSSTLMLLQNGVGNYFQINNLSSATNGMVIKTQKNHIFVSYTELLTTAFTFTGTGTQNELHYNQMANVTTTVLDQSVGGTNQIFSSNGTILSSTTIANGLSVTGNAVIANGLTVNSTGNGFVSVYRAGTGNYDTLSFGNSPSTDEWCWQMKPSDSLGDNTLHLVDCQNGGDVFTFIKNGSTTIDAPNGGSIILPHAVVASTTFTANQTTTLPSVSASSLLFLDSGHHVIAYSGASACAAGNAVTTISAAGGTTCAAFGSSNVSTSTANTWTALQTFTGGLTSNSSTLAGRISLPSSTASSLLATDSNKQVTSTSVGAYLGLSGGSLTVSSTLTTSSFSFAIPNATTTTSGGGNYLTTVKTFTAKTLTSVDCWDYGGGGTSTLAFYYATSTTSTSTSVWNTIVASLVCGGKESSTSTNVSLPIGARVLIVTTSTTGMPSNTIVDGVGTKT